MDKKLFCIKKDGPKIDTVCLLKQRIGLEEERGEGKQLNPKILIVCALLASACSQTPVGYGKIHLGDQPEAVSSQVGPPLSPCPGPDSEGSRRCTWRVTDPWPALVSVDFAPAGVFQISALPDASAPQPDVILAALTEKYGEPKHVSSASGEWENWSWKRGGRSIALHRMHRSFTIEYEDDVARKSLSPGRRDAIDEAKSKL